MADDRLHTHELPAGERRAILDRVRAHLAGIEGIRAVYAYGSFARGEPFRDLDVAVLLEDSADWRGVGRVDERVGAALGKVPFEVDVVPLNDASPRFRRAVVRDGERLYESGPDVALEFEVRSISEYMDFEAFRSAHGLVD
jgi:predicted nucleotidyltransferase